MNATEILRKMKIKEEGVILNAPFEFEEAFHSVGFDTTINSTAKTILLFLANSNEFVQNFENACKLAAYDAQFWLCYPKGASKLKSDINRDILWKMVEPYGYSPVMIVSLDNNWSGLRIRPSELVKRKDK